jgi:cupin fold WbuC family metalloprotein
VGVVEIDSTLLDGVSAEAQASPRRRKNRNFHGSDDEPCHRLLNAVEPGTYIRPHRHLGAHKDEAMLLVRGRMGLVFFDDAGGVAGTVVASAGGPVFGVDIPRGTFHTLVSLEPGTVFFEAKAGPYLPLTEEEKGVWAPDENDSAAARYLERLASLFDR